MEENRPEIRFKGFERPWEKRKLGDTLSLLKDGTHGTHQDSEAGPLLLSAKNIKNGKICWDKSDRRISYTEYENIFSTYQLKEGDVLLTIVGSIGETAIFHQTDKIAFQRSVAFLRPQKELASSFLFCEIQNNKFQGELNNRKSTSAQPGIYLGNVADIPIFFPESISEQMVIGELLKNIDGLIVLQQQKLDQLKTLKKACLEKMFPKNGSIVPEIRFAGFADAWEQRKLGDVARILGGNAWKASDYSDDGEYLVVTIANVSGEVIINDSVGNRISCDNPDVYLLNKGDILVSLTGNVGRVSKMSNIKGLLNQRVGKILPNNSDINADFLFHVLRNPHFERAMIDAGQGAAQKNIRNDDVLNYAFFLPVEKDEQNIIAHYFNRLDNLITLHQRKLDKLKSLKQACLEKMFV